MKHAFLISATLIATATQALAVGTLAFERPRLVDIEGIKRGNPTVCLVTWPAHRDGDRASPCFRPGPSPAPHAR